MAKPAIKEASTPPSSKKKVVAPPPPPQESPKGTPSAGTIIGNRITAAVKEYPLKQRSSDLVPLTREFETMRRKLRGLSAAVKAYPTSLASVDQARFEVSTRTVQHNSVRESGLIHEAAMRTLHYTIFAVHLRYLLRRNLTLINSILTQSLNNLRSFRRSRQSPKAGPCKPPSAEPTTRIP